MHVFISSFRLLRIGLVALIGCVVGATLQAQTKVRVSVSAIYKPTATTVEHSLKIDLGNGRPILNAEVTDSVLNGPTHELGWVEIDEGGAGFSVKMDGVNVHHGEVDIYLADRQDEYVLMLNGRQERQTYITSVVPGNDSKSVTVTVFKKSRLKSVLGGAQSGAGVGACSSPYLQPNEGVMMDLNLGLTQNGQPLPALRLNYLNIGYILPEHVDIVADSSNQPDAYPKTYRLPQATLTINQQIVSHHVLSNGASDDVVRMIFSFARPDSTSPYVTYTFVQPDYHTDQGGDGTEGRAKWERKYEADLSTRIDVSNGPRFQSTTSGDVPANYTVEDWHATGLTAPRLFTFVKASAGDEVITKNQAGTVASHTRIEYQSYTEPSSDPEFPGQTISTPKKMIRGFGGGSELATEQLMLTNNEVRGAKQPDGSATTFFQNSYQAGSTGAAGTTKRVARSWLNNAPDVMVADSAPANVLVSEYEYAADWTGLKTLPSRVVTSAAGKLISDESIVYVTDLQVAVSNTTQTEKVTAATRTVYDAPAGAPNRHALETISKKFQPNTGSFFYADLFHSLQNADGTKQSFAYQRGNIAVGGSFAAVANPDAPETPATNAVQTIILSGLKSESTDTSPLVSPSFPGASFDRLSLVANRSTATVEVRRFGLPVRTETWICTSATTATFALVAWENVTYTPCGGVTLRTTSRGTTYEAHWICDQKDYEIDETGQRTDYAYDAAGRIRTVTRAQVALGGVTIPEQRTSFEYDGDNHVTKVTVGPATGEQLLTTYRYNLAGQMDRQTNSDGTTVDYAYTNGGRHVEITANQGKGLPYESTRIIDRFVDGRVISVTGNAGVPEFHTYDFESRTIAGASVDFPRSTVYFGSSDGVQNTARYQTVVGDILGRPSEQRSPSRPGSSNLLVRQISYDDKGRLARIHTVERAGSTDTAVSADTLYHYDSFGQLTSSGLKLDAGTGDLSAGGSDRFVTTTGQFDKRGGSNWWTASSLTSYEKDNSATPITTNSYSRVSGLESGGLVAETEAYDVFNNLVSASTYLDRGSKVRNEIIKSADGSAIYQDFVGGFLVFERMYAAGVTPSDTNFSSRTTYRYDALGRVMSLTDSRGIVTTTEYDLNKARAHYTHSGLNVGGQPIRTATYEYDDAGRVKSFTDAANRVSNYAYNVRGQIVDEWGDGTHPTHYEYDAVYGNRTELWTYRGLALGAQGGTTGADKTKWSYDPATGLLTTKTDAATSAVTYAYNYDFNAGEKLITRTAVGRNIVTTYRYRLATGDLTDVSYVGGPIATPAVHYTYTRAGRLDTVTDATTLPGEKRRFSYENGQQRGEFLPAFFNNRVLTTNYQDVTDIPTQKVKGRYRGFQLGYAAAPATDVTGDASEMSVGVGYDTLGRIGSLRPAYPGYSATTTYTYTGGTSHWEKLVHGGFQINRDLQANRNLMGEVSARFGGDAAPAIVDFVYAYEARGLIESTKQWGAAYDDFGDRTFTKYVNDELGRLKESTAYFGQTLTDTSKPLHGRGFQYDYDSAGNRKTVTVDGGTPYVEVATYKDTLVDPSNGWANNLNQVVRRGTLKTHASGTVGTTAQANPTVTVNGATTRRQGAYWDVGLDFAGQSATVTATATLGAQSQSSLGVATLFRPTTETFSYDADGNMLGDSVWTYVWDGENRLRQMTTQSWVTPSQTIFFTYDYAGRRVRKVVEVNSAPSSDCKYVYDGWNLVAEFAVSSPAQIARSYVWGLDAAGSLTGTGGIGALVLAVTHASGAVTVRDVVTDGRGNVVALVDPANGAPTAIYEYDPFGQLLRQSGAEAAANPFRFSTKYCDVETGLYYYGYRYYDATLGRFINRDPQGEAGGINLYAFVGNNPVNGWDYLGMGLLDVILGRTDIFGNPVNGPSVPYSDDRGGGVRFIPMDGFGGISFDPYADGIDDYDLFTGASGTPVRAEEMFKFPVNGPDDLDNWFSGRRNPYYLDSEGRSRTQRFLIGVWVASLQDHNLNPFSIDPPETGDLDERNGRLVGHAANFLVGIIEMKVGGAIVGGSGLLALGSGGSLGGVAVLTGAGGLAIGADGTHAVYSGSKNLTRMLMEGGGLSRGGAKPARSEAPKPRYDNPGTHDPNHVNYVKGKTDLPPDAETLYRNAVPDKVDNPKNWYARAPDGKYYRYSSSADGTAHFNGIFTREEVPTYVLKRTGER